METAKISDALGVEVFGLDLSKPITNAEQKELRRLFCEYHLLLVRDQHIEPEDHRRFVEYFGPLDPASGDVTNAEPPSTKNTGQQALVWHSDGTYATQPWIGISLWAKEVSPDSTPTWYANAVRALEQLPPDLRQRVDGLHAVHVSDSKPQVLEDPDLPYGTDFLHKRTRVSEIAADAPPDRYRSTEHPLVFQLPHTAQKTLLVHQLMVSHIVELPPDEGEALIQDLFQRIYEEPNTYFHHWRTGDVMIWDNLALQHNRPAPIGREIRRMGRQTLAGWNAEDGVLDYGPDPAVTRAY